MRLTVKIPCLWQLGFIPRFDGYSCQVLAPLCVFLLLIGFISFNMNRNDARESFMPTESFTSVAKPGERHPNEKDVGQIVQDKATDRTDTSLHYGVIVDCGSSGSRVYLYHWPPHSGASDQLLNIQPVRDQQGRPYIKKIEPGLSSFANKPSKAAEYLKPLLEYAADVVPRDKHHETPLYVSATAGLRMLSDSDQAVILSDLRVDIPLWYNFLFGETHAEVISGKQEAIYAWISINYALGRFDHSGGVSEDEHLSLIELPGPDTPTHVRKQTVGVLDMGGASLQVAMEVPHSENIAKGLVSEFSLGCTKNDMDHVYRIYIATFLNYGSNTARKIYEQTLFSNFSSVNINGSSVPPVVNDPCLPVNFREQISATSGDQMITLQGTGVYHDCKNKLRLLLNTSAPCLKEPCSLNGVFQPDIDFEHSQFYGFAEFFYTMEDLLHIGGNYNYRQFQTLAREYCAREWSELEDWQQKSLHPRADSNRYRLQCFKSVWMTLILHEGLKFPKTYQHLTSVQYIEDEEIHWTLGALLYKTRYYPLRDLEQEAQYHYRPSWTVVDLHYINYLVILCIIIVLAAIVLYVRRLRPCRTELRRVPTMSYFMTDDDQTEDGLIRVEGFDSQYYGKHNS